MFLLLRSFFLIVPQAYFFPLPLMHRLTGAETPRPHLKVLIFPERKKKIDSFPFFELLGAAGFRVPRLTPPKQTSHYFASVPKRFLS